MEGQALALPCAARGIGEAGGVERALGGAAPGRGRTGRGAPSAHPAEPTAKFEVETLKNGLGRLENPITGPPTSSRAALSPRR